MVSVISVTHNFVLIFTIQIKNFLFKSSKVFPLSFFHILGFVSRTLTIHWTVGEGLGHLLTLLYNFHPFADPQTLNGRLVKSSPLHIIQLAAGLEQKPFVFERKSLTTKIRVLHLAPKLHHVSLFRQVKFSTCWYRRYN